MYLAPDQGHRILPCYTPLQYCVGTNMCCLRSYNLEQVLDRLGVCNLGLVFYRIYIRKHVVGLIAFCKYCNDYSKDWECVVQHSNVLYTSIPSPFMFVCIKIFYGTWQVWRGGHRVRRNTLSLSCLVFQLRLSHFHSPLRLFYLSGVYKIRIVYLLPSSV